MLKTARLQAAIVVAIGALASACASGNPQQSVSYNQGYQAGCDAGTAAAAASGTVDAHDAARLAADPTFRQGWASGDAVCYDKRNWPFTG